MDGIENYVGWTLSQSWLLVDTYLLISLALHTKKHQKKREEKKGNRKKNSLIKENRFVRSKLQRCYLDTDTLFGSAWICVTLLHNLCDCSTICVTLLHNLYNFAPQSVWLCSTIYVTLFWKLCDCSTNLVSGSRGVTALLGLKESCALKGTQFTECDHHARHWKGPRVKKYPGPYHLDQNRKQT